MFGGTDPNTGEKLKARRELVRMALPRRVYTNSHIDFVAEAASKIGARKVSLSGFRITREAKFLRHFTCELEQLAPRRVEISGS